MKQNETTLDLRSKKLKYCSKLNIYCQIFRQNPKRKMTTEIQDYDHIKELGSGCFSDTSLARNNKNQQLYAVKCCQLKKTIPKDKLSRFYPEIDFRRMVEKSRFKEDVRLHKLFNSKGVGPKLHASWTDGDDLGYIVLDVWDRALEFQDTISQDVVSKIETQINVINNLGYVHMDIILSNILVKLDENGKIVDATLTDFGATTRIDNVQNDEVYQYICKTSKLDPEKPMFVDVGRWKKMKEMMLQIS